jgi:hypothetical protein
VERADRLVEGGEHVRVDNRWAAAGLEYGSRYISCGRMGRKEQIEGRHVQGRVSITDRDDGRRAGRSRHRVGAVRRYRVGRRQQTGGLMAGGQV